MRSSAAVNFDSIYDCIIIGAGPAGLTCSIFLARYRRPVLIIDSGKPRNYASHGIHGFLGQHGIKPGELLARGREEATSVGVTFCDDVATKIERCGDHFEVTTASGVAKGRRIVLAYGVRDTLPDVDGFEDYYGWAAFHCPDCDGFEVSEKNVGVIGWGKKVAALTLKLLQWTSQLTVFTHGNDPDLSPEEMSKLQAEGIAVVEPRVSRLIGTPQQLRAVELEDGSRFDVEAIFFTIGVQRSCDLAEQLGCEIDAEKPDLVVDEHRETSVTGVYAVGDLIAGSQLAITSAADGAIAAIAVNQSLLPPARRV